MVKRVKYLPGGGKVTVEDMTEEEFRKIQPNAIEIKSEADVEKLARSLGVEYPKKKFGEEYLCRFLMDDKNPVDLE